LTVAGGKGRGGVGDGEGSREGLEPSGGLAGSRGEDARGSHVVAVANGERAVDGSVISDSVVAAPYFIIDVVTKLRGVRVARVAHFKTKHVATNEVDPFNNLCGSDSAVGTTTHLLSESCGILPKSVRVDNSTKGVALLVITVGIKFTTLVLTIEVDLRLINVTDDLDVILGIQPLSSSNGARGDYTSPMSRLRSP